MDDVDDAASAIMEDARKDLEDGGFGIDKPMDNTRLMDALDKAGDATSGQEKLAVNLAKISVERMTAFAAKLTAVSSDLTDGLDYSGVEKVEDLDALSDKIRSYRTVNAEVKADFSTDFIDGLKKEADKMGLKGSTKAGFFNAMESKYNKQLPLIKEIRDLDDELCVVVLEQHDLLRKYYGQWSWTENGLQFENDEALEAYNVLAGKLEPIGQAQIAAQRKLLALQ